MAVHHTDSAYSSWFSLGTNAYNKSANVGLHIMFLFRCCHTLSKLVAFCRFPIDESKLWGLSEHCERQFMSLSLISLPQIFSWVRYTKTA